MEKIKLAGLAFIISGSILLPTCNSNDKTASSDDSTSMAMGNQDESAHIYACPMHPEVTGKEGDNCPKCGMKLVHNDHAGAGNGLTYLMDFKTNPSSVVSKQEVTLSMTPKIKGKESDQVPLQEEHTKKIHLIVVSDDLSYFDHIHPEYGADGSYTVKTKFPSGGKYTLFADYKPTGGNHTVDKLNIDVTGNKPAAKNYSSDKLTATSSDGFSVTLTPEGGKFETNVALHLAAGLKQNGKDVDPSTLEDYLGAKAHMVVVSLTDKEYLHVHPGVENGKFDLHTTFEKPGVYRGWIQFQSKGKVHTTDFVMNVKQGSGKAKADDAMEGMKH
ncbi:MAG: hypothetical protein H7Y07_05730 [Pyrinomonadaceae bacterium]|nr:hypothetical protein [Sphingobacteriaceae bacterium]